MEHPVLENWIESTNEELDQMKSIPENKPRPSRGRKSTIHKVPASLRETVPSEYWEPRHLRLGPYHASHEYSPLKRRVFLFFLKTSNEPLNVYVEAVHDIVQELKDAYDELDLEPWLQDDHAFLMLMIQDGCVLVETLRELADFNLTRYIFTQDYKRGHPLWDINGINRRDLFEYYKHDMLLLENQLPMELLVRLIAVQSNQTVAFGLIRLWLRWTLKPSTWLFGRDDSNICLHLLDLYRNGLVGKIHIGRRRRIPTFNVIIPSATNLKNAGIRIKMRKTESLMDISIKRGNLMLPQIFLDADAQSRFINIIALEQLHENANEVTSYIYLMSSFIRDANDVRILRSSGIILTGLRNDEIVEMFNNLTEQLIKHDPHTFLIPEYKAVIKSLKETFEIEWKKDLWQKYLGNPWAIISLVAAFLLFLLTLVQTAYTILGYYNSK